MKKEVGAHVIEAVGNLIMFIGMASAHLGGERTRYALRAFVILCREAGLEDYVIKRYLGGAAWDDVSDMFEGRT